MLDRLPNEILVKILEKTKLKTSRECRLLSLRFNKIIEKAELYKEDIGYISISTVPGRSYICHFDRNRRFIWHQNYATLEQVFESISQKMQKIRRVYGLLLRFITINHRALEILLDANCFRHLRGVYIEECGLNTKDLSEMWAQFFTRSNNTRVCMHTTYEHTQTAVLWRREEFNTKEVKRNMMQDVSDIAEQMSKTRECLPICMGTPECHLTMAVKLTLQPLKARLRENQAPSSIRMTEEDLF